MQFRMTVFKENRNRVNGRATAVALPLVEQHLGVHYVSELRLVDPDAARKKDAHSDKTRMAGKDDSKGNVVFGNSMRNLATGIEARIKHETAVLGIRISEYAIIFEEHSVEAEYTRTLLCEGAQLVVKAKKQPLDGFEKTEFFIELERIRAEINIPTDKTPAI